MPTSTPAVRGPCLNRRGFLALTAGGATGLAMRGPAPVAAPTAAGPADGTLPVTGAADPGLEPFDRLMTAFVAENGVPGAALAVTRNGKLVYARGFGYADLAAKTPVRPAALFRIASVSKPITGVAVMQLVGRGKLGLNDRVLERMRLTPFLAPGTEPDPRWRGITVRQCLQHTGGWDRDASFDPIARPWQIAAALGIEPPVTPDHIVRYMLGQPLDFDPGSRHVYSNLGFLVLGRVIEAVSGQPYGAYVTKEVFAPLGVRTAQLGRALVEDRAAGEVRYYDRAKRSGRALYPPRLGQQVPLPDGAENLEAFEAHGGWVASAVDLVRFAAAFDDPARCPILSAAAITEMWARPSGPAGFEADDQPKAAYYNSGWSVRPVGKAGKANTWHTGLIAGTEAILVRRWDGLNWAVLFNTQHSPDGKSLAGLIDGRVHQAADQVTAWPGIDRFAEFLQGQPP